MMFYSKLLLQIWKLLVKRSFRRITEIRTYTAMSELNKHFETVKTPLLAAGMVSAVGALTLRLDQYLGHRNVVDESGNELDFFVHERPQADTTLVLLGGLCMTGEHVAQRFDRQLSDNVNLVSPIYAPNGLNTGLLFDRLFDEVEKTNPRHIKIAGLSMGGLLSWDWLDHGLKTGRRETVEKVSEVALRGVPAEQRAIRTAPRMLLNTVNKHGYSYALDHSRPLLKRWNCVSLLEASPATIVQQCRYLADRHDSAPSVLPERIVFLRANVPDPIVKEDTAVACLERRLGRSIEQAVDTSYNQSSHIPTDQQSVRFMLYQLGIAKQLPAEEQVLAAPLPHTAYYPAAA